MPHPGHFSTDMTAPHYAQIIPALERVLSLVGADVCAWYTGLPRAVRMMPQKRPGMSARAVQLRLGGGSGPLTRQGSGLSLAQGQDRQRASGPGGERGAPRRGPAATGAPLGGSAVLRQGVIEQHFLSSHCAVCDEQTLPSRPLCPRCALISGPDLSGAVHPSNPKPRTLGARANPGPQWPC